MPKKSEDVPQFSVIIPVREIGYFLLFENLPALDELQNVSFEVIVLPNSRMTNDMSLMKKYPWLRIIPTGTVTRPAQKRDIGVREAKGEFIAFIDDDAYPSPRWLAAAAVQFQKKSIHAVCGPGALPKNTNRWEIAFDDILTSKIGSGSYTYRFTPGYIQYVTDYPSMNLLIRKSTFLKLGGFNSNYWPGEDSKLCNDLITRHKKSIIYSPDVLIYHHRRNQLRSFLRQHGQYGYHRGTFFAHGDENSRDIAYLVPTAFFSYCMLLLLYTPISFMNDWPRQYMLFASIPLLLYILLVLYIMVKSLMKRASAIISLYAASTLVAMHFVYGWQFIVGYTRAIRNKDIYDTTNNQS